MSKTTKRLQSAKAKISDKKNWVKDTFARNADNIVVPSTDKSACKFCVIGSLNSVIGTLEQNSLAHTFLHDAAKRQGYNGAMQFNDHEKTSHPMIMDVYDRAIKASQRLDKKRAEEEKKPKKKGKK